MVTRHQPLATIERRLITIDVNPFTQAFRDIDKDEEVSNPRTMGMRSAQLDLIIITIPSIDNRTSALFEDLKARRDRVLSGYTPEEMQQYRIGYLETARDVFIQVFQ